MPLLLTTLSVLALWGFLAVLAFGLLRLRHALESVRQHLERTLVVVRTVETQTEPLGALGVAFALELASAAGGWAALARALDRVERGLAALS